MLDTKERMSLWLPCVLADKMVLETNFSLELPGGVASSALTRPEMVGR
jgi:hypothetical protein